MKFILLLFSFSLVFLNGYAQQPINIRGTVKAAEGTYLSKATVILYFPGEKDSLKTLTDETGAFRFTNVKSGNMSIRVSYIGFKPFNKNYDYSGKKGEQELTGIVLDPTGDMLQNITLESQKVQIKEDTVSYKIDSTMYRKNDNVETLLKQLPGVQVDKDGTVTAQGKQVTKVKVNGKEFFGGDVTTATRELNADMVDKIQVIDDYGDQAAFTGVKDGDPGKTLNIQLRKDKNKGYFGNLTAGAGTENRYVGSLSVNKFNNTQQLSVLTNINNTNASLFNFGSMGGAMGNVISSMARGMGIGRGGGGVASALGNFGNSDGISTNKSAGFNYRDEWGKKISAYGSYSFSNRGTSTIKNVTQQNIFENRTSTNIQNSDNYSVTENHRASFNIEYKIDSMNYIKFSPALTYSKTNSDYISDFLFLGNNGIKNNEGTTADKTFSKSPNLNGNLLYNHRFARRGRTLSMNFSAGQSGTRSTDDYENLSTYYLMGGTNIDTNLYQKIIQDNENRNYGVRASYTEPLSKKRNLEFNYSYNYQFITNDRETFSMDPVSGNKTYIDTLSNIYDNTYITNRFGVNFRTTEKKYNYTIGLTLQPATIKSYSYTGKYSFKQDLINYYPVIRFAYNFSRSRSLNINYNGSTSQPSYTQLQPVYDYSNPQYITLGNPNLRPEFTNTFSMRYNNFDFITGDVFFGNISFSFTKDKIVNNTIFRGFGVQETQYRNSDGFYTATGFYNISKPFQNRKYVLNIGGNIIYNNNISFLDSVKNTGRNFVIGQRLATDIKIKKWLETSAGVNYSLNSTRYTLQQQLNANTVAWTLTHSSRFFLPKDFILSYDIDKTINTGFASNVNANPLIINSTLEKQLFKKKNASIKLQAFDLLNENTSINRTVTGSAITDTRSNRLGRYFLLSFVLRLNKFSGQMQQGMQMGIPGGGSGMPMMRPPGM